MARRKLVSVKSLLRDCRGFSITETMLAAGLASTIALAVVGVMQSASYFEKTTQAKEAVVANLAKMGYDLQLNLQQAIDISTSAVDLNNTLATPTSGRIRLAFDSNTVGVVPNGTNRVDTLAIFIGEFGSSFNAGALNTRVSRFRGVGIYYLHNEPDSSGAVFVSTVGPPVANAQLDITGASSMYDGLVGFSIDNVRVFDGAAGGQATSVQFHAIGRYFTGQDRTTFARWCHPARMGGAGCPNQISYVDIERVFNIVLRNNRVNDTGRGLVGTRGGIANVVGIMGTLHFFSSIPHRTEGNL